MKFFLKLVLIAIVIPACVPNKEKQKEKSSSHQISFDEARAEAKEILPLGLSVWESLFGIVNSRIEHLVDLYISTSFVINDFKKDKEILSQQFEQIFKEIKPKFDDISTLVEIEEWRTRYLDANLGEWSMTEIWINAHKGETAEEKLKKAEEYFSEKRSCLLKAKSEKEAKDCLFDQNYDYSDLYP